MCALPWFHILHACYMVTCIKEDQQINMQWNHIQSWSWTECSDVTWKKHFFAFSWCIAPCDASTEQALHLCDSTTVVLGSVIHWFYDILHTEKWNIKHVYTLSTLKKYFKWIPCMSVLRYIQPVCTLQEAFKIAQV